MTALYDLAALLMLVCLLVALAWGWCLVKEGGR